MGQLEILNEGEIDVKKMLSERALSFARSLQSPETGYLHLYYGDTHSKAQSIPFLENCLFVLALFQSRLVEQIQEGKGMLKRLLAFQNRGGGEEQGNFPVYLHQYPECRDPALSIQVLAPLYWILKEFGHVLGSSLKEEVEQGVKLALENGLRSNAEKPFPYFLAVRAAAVEYAYGLLWGVEAWSGNGANKLTELAQDQLNGWSSPKQLADLLVGLQMIPEAFSTGGWQPLWQRMTETWHPYLSSYIGPCVRDWQKGAEPLVTLYDLFGGVFSGHFSHRSLLPGPHLLSGVLIQPSSHQFKSPSSFTSEGVLQGQAWKIFSHSDWAYTALEKKGASQPAVDKTHTPFRMVWGDSHLLHSLVCQGGNIEQADFQVEEKGISFRFDLKEEPSEREVEFFVDFHPDVQFRLEGEVMNSFRLGDKLQLSFQGHKLTCVFELMKGQGDFFAHIIRGNRPSQIDNKGEKRFHSYDWAFFLRSVRRESRCRVGLTLTYET